MKKISVMIAGRHATSLTLENAFYDALKQIVKAQKTTITALVTTIDGSREDMSLSSALRVYILKYFQEIGKK